MNNLVLRDGKIFLDGLCLENVKEFDIASSADGVAELTVKPDVELSENAIEQPPAQHYTVDVTAEVDTEKAVGQTEELIALLKKANSLTDELAVILSNLKLDIKL